MSKRGKIFQFRKAIHMNFTPFFFMVAQRATAFGRRGEGLAPGSGAIYSWLPGLTFPNEHHWAPQFHLPHLATLSLIHGRNQPLNFFFHPSVWSIALNKGKSRVYISSGEENLMEKIWWKRPTLPLHVGSGTFSAVIQRISHHPDEHHLSKSVRVFI